MPLPQKTQKQFQKLRAISLLLGAILLGTMEVLSLSSCAEVVIRDYEFCGSLGPEGSACFHTMTDQTETLTLNQWALKWDSMSDPQVCSGASTFADLKGDIEKLCSFGNYCTYEMNSRVQSLSQKLNKVISSAKNQKP